MANYLLDANYLIYLYDPNADATKKKEILSDFQDKLQDNNSKFFITPLIRYEILRGIKWDHLDELQSIKDSLKGFSVIHINNDISDLARNLFRLDKNLHDSGSPKKIEKHQFDIFHFATAKENELEILSKDKDMLTLNNLYQQFEENKKA